MKKGNPGRNIQQEKNRRKEPMQSCSSRPPSRSKVENVICIMAHVLMTSTLSPKSNLLYVLRAIFKYDAQ